jgi:hypothetical protein
MKTRDKAYIRSRVESAVCNVMPDNISEYDFDIIAKNDEQLVSEIEIISSRIIRLGDYVNRKIRAGDYKKILKESQESRTDDEDYFFRPGSAGNHSTWVDVPDTISTGQSYSYNDIQQIYRSVVGRSEPTTENDEPENTPF